jgi:membrane fusion protein (multidrug efflux system)
MNLARSLLLITSLLLTFEATAASAPGKSAPCYARQDLTARSQGFVDAVLVKDGDLVKKGDVLIQLDSRLLVAGRKEAAAGVKAAQAQLRLAADGHKRLRQMAASDTVTEQELVQAEVRLEQARAQLAQAQAVLERVSAQLADTEIRAEVDGKVLGLPNVKGLFVQAGQSLGRVEAEASPCTATSTH